MMYIFRIRFKAVSLMLCTAVILLVFAHTSWGDLNNNSQTTNLDRCPGGIYIPDIIIANRNDINSILKALTTVLNIAYFQVLNQANTNDIGSITTRQLVEVHKIVADIAASMKYYFAKNNGPLTVKFACVPIIPGVNPGISSGGVIDDGGAINLDQSGSSGPSFNPYKFGTSGEGDIQKTTSSGGGFSSIAGVTGADFGVDSFDPTLDLDGTLPPDDDKDKGNLLPFFEELLGPRPPWFSWFESLTFTCYPPGGNNCVWSGGFTWTFSGGVSTTAGIGGSTNNGSGSSGTLIEPDTLFVNITFNI